MPLPFAELAEAMDILPVSNSSSSSGACFAMGVTDRSCARNRRGAYLLPAKADLIKGRVRSPMAMGSSSLTMRGRTFSWGRTKCGKSLHGDRVMVRIAGMDRRGRPEGKVVEVLERANTRPGVVVVENGVTLVVPENRRISQEILLAPATRPKFKAAPGRVVVVEDWWSSPPVMPSLSEKIVELLEATTRQTRDEVEDCPAQA